MVVVVVVVVAVVVGCPVVVVVSVVVVVVTVVVRTWPDAGAIFVFFYLQRNARGMLIFCLKAI